MPGEHAKTRATYYTPERVAAARENADRYDWAAKLREEAVEAAEERLDRGLDWLWRRVTGQAIPRTWGPVNGTQHEAWDPHDDRAWKVTDGEWVLPTNDFGAYRESGRDDEGQFDPDLADDSLLVNEEYPEFGDTWGVDDGYGFVDGPGHVQDAGDVWMPVACYNHWAIWYDLRDAAVSLRDAYVFTGEGRYATAATILLDRIADVYPGMDISEHDHLDGVHNSTGGTGQGKLVGSIWETNLVRDFVSVYDAVFPAQEGDETALAFLQEKSTACPGLDGKGSTEGVRTNVEEGLVRQVLPAIQCAQIRGNFGHHQSALAMSAVVADDPTGYTGDALEFLFRPGELVNEDDQTLKEYEAAHGGPSLSSGETGWRVTGGDVAPALVDRIDRDGHGHESAPNYNRIVGSHSRRIARILDVYDGDVPDEPYVNADLFDHPKLRRTYRGMYSLIQLDAYTPQIGDSGKTGNPEVLASADDAAEAFDRYGDPEFARAAHALNGYDHEGLHASVFTGRDVPLADAVRDVVEAEGPLDLGSTLLPAYGFAALRDGDRPVSDGGRRDADDQLEEDTRRDAWLYFGRNSSETGTSHAHPDTLNLGVHAFGLDLAPDLGYPEHTGGWPKRWNWTANTVSHNTVVVDDERQQPQVVAQPLAFADGDHVQLVDVEAPDVYPQTDAYRRTVAMVRIDDGRSYLVDVFEIAGGDEHVYSFHGAAGDVTTDGLDLENQAGGTYAGASVDRPGHGEETSYDESVGNGYNYLSNVEREGNPDERFAVDWAIEDTWGVHEQARDVHLRLTALADCHEVALADGEPPRNKEGNPESLRYLLARRSGSDLRSVFASVLEPYEDERAIESIERVPVVPESGDDPAGDTTAIAVRLRDGRTDYVLRASVPDETYVVDDVVRVRGRFAVYAEREGAAVFAQVVGGDLVDPIHADRTLIDRRCGHVTGTVLDVTRELSVENELVVRPDAPEAAEAIEPGVHHVHVSSDGPRNGVFAVEGVDADGENLRIDLGNATPIQGFVDAERPEEGYEFEIEVGADCSVPLIWTWET